MNAAARTKQAVLQAVRDENVEHGGVSRQRTWLMSWAPCDDDLVAALDAREHQHGRGVERFEAYRLRFEGLGLLVTEDDHLAVGRLRDCRAGYDDPGDGCTSAADDGDGCADIQCRAWVKHFERI